MRASRLFVVVTVVMISAATSALPVRAAPRPVTSCPFTATTDVRLTVDLPCAGTSGIIVGANRITIDLGGHTLTGDRTANTVGILNNAHVGVRVRNGTVERFGSGVLANSADRMRVQRVVSSGNANEGIWIYGQHVSVASSQVSGNSANGILLNGTSARVISSQASGNGAYGIWVQGKSALVSLSQAWGNAGHGIVVGGAFIVCPGTGPCPSFPPRVVSSQASGNGGRGISIGTILGGARVISSRASGNGTTGIYVSSASAIVKSSTASGNGAEGIYIGGPSALVKSSHASGNAQDGMYIEGNSARVTSSRASGNDFHGIEVKGDAARIGQSGRRISDRNTADANGFVDGVPDDAGFGVFVHDFTTAPVGRNVARGNDNGADCDAANLCVAAGPSPPVRAPTVAVTSCPFTATTDVKLMVDLTCFGNDGIIVGADGITIDLGGHTLTGNRTASFDGIRNTGHVGVVVRNGTVERFFVGVYGFHVDRMRVLRVTASGNAGSGIAIGGARIDVTSSQASGNSSFGIKLDATAPRVISSQASGNGGDGIWVQGKSALVSLSQAWGNHGDGIVVSGLLIVCPGTGPCPSFPPRVVSSQASGNGGRGISIDAVMGGASGISSQATGNGTTGIYVVSASARLISSQTSGNAGGISIFGASASVSSSQASGNTYGGIYIEGNSARVTSSRAAGNDGHGIEVKGDSARIGQVGRRAADRNTADANGFVNGAQDGAGLGIYVHDFTTAPVGRNVARGNDNTADCDTANLC